MKKLIIITLLFLPALAIAQKADTTKVQYEKFVKINLADFQTFINALEQWKRLEVYDPKGTDQDKVKRVKDIDAYIKGMETRLKIDSAIVTKPKKK